MASVRGRPGDGLLGRVLSGLLALLCLLPFAATAQDKPLSAFYRETWTTRQGLPHNQVNAIAQSPDGYLWLGTWEGLVRYNGLEFHVFDRANTPELKDNGIRSVRASEDGAVVIGTSRGGVTVKRGDRWRTWMEKDGLAQEEIMDALLDRQGRLWVATESAGITRIDKDAPTQFNTRNGLPSDVVYGLLLDRDGGVWAATAEGLVHFIDGRIRVYRGEAGLPAAPIFRVMQDATGTVFAGTERGVYRMQGERFVSQSPLLPEDGVPSLARDNAGNLWVGTVNNGLVRLGSSGAERFTSVRGLPNNRVAALLVDREGSIWAGTNAGLLRLSDASFSTWNGDQGLSDDYVRALYEAPRGGMWIGTSRGLNLWRDGRIEATYSAADGLPSDSVLSLLESRDGSLLVGSYTDGVLRMRDGKVVGHYDNARGMPGSNQVRALAEEADGTLWIGTSRGLARYRDGTFKAYGLAEGLPREFIISLHIARDGSLWVGTANGAAKIVGGKVRALDMRPINGAQDVFDFHEDADGTLWLATDRGLLRYRNGVLRGLAIREGLPVDTMFTVVDDELGHLWMTSNRGVLRIKRSDAEAVLDGRLAQLPYDHFGEADGLVSAQCNGGSGPAALRDSRGNIWVATSRGAAVTSPSRLQSYRHQLPQVVLEQAYANDKPASAHNGLLRLPPGTHKLEFRYAALSFLMPRFLRYRYRLEGEDSDWIERANQRVAQYTNLKPGRYRFLVDVSAPTLGRDWSGNPTVIDIEIKPQPWQQAWFLAVATLLLGLLLFAIYRWRLGNLRKRATELEDVIDQRTSALREQTDRLMESDREKSILLARLKEQSEAFERMALEDALTGIGNRRHFDARLSHAFDRAVETRQPLSFALFDVDEFKRINDQYSHAAGDHALVAVAHALQAGIEGRGSIARWGGEEFAVLFEGMPLDEARQLCEQLRARVQAIDCTEFAPGWSMTISAGVTERTGLAHHEKLVSRADALLYEAKRAGRNRICG
jgi:diguanylate cyclase (GGDEF)-like protein